MFFTKYVLPSKKTSLVTAFELFGGSDINWSANVAQLVQSQLSAADIEVKICTLPVIYDESAAHNHDSTPDYPDNSGTIRTGSVIQVGGHDKVAFKPFVMGLYCSADPKTQKSLIVSESPEGFVCNNTAYTQGTFFEKLKIPYSFIHAPSHTSR